MNQSSFPFYVNQHLASSPLREKSNSVYRADETQVVTELVDYINFSKNVENEIAILAKKLIESVRENQSERSDIEDFMLQYDLSMEELR